MQYLLKDIYSKALDSEEYQKKWLECNNTYNEVYCQNKHRLPKAFIIEYEKKLFHDSVIEHFQITRKLLNRGSVYDIEIHLSEHAEPNIKHVLIFKDVDHIMTDLIFRFNGHADWLYAEILPVSENQMSLEILLFSDSSIYFKFSKLKYRKEHV